MLDPVALKDERLLASKKIRGPKPAISGDAVNSSSPSPGSYAPRSFPTPRVHAHARPARNTSGTSITAGLR